jgi:hypothetical protein
LYEDLSFDSKDSRKELYYSMESGNVCFLVPYDDAVMAVPMVCPDCQEDFAGPVQKVSIVAVGSGDDHP